MSDGRSIPLRADLTDLAPPAGLLIVNVVAGITNMAWSLAAPVIPLYAAAQGASPATIGGVVSLSAFLPLLFAIHGGALVDLYGAPAVMRWSAVVYAGALVVLATLPGLPLVALAYGLLGLALTGLIVGPQSLVAAWSTPAERARRFGYHSFWVSAGMVSGPLVGGVLVDVVGYGVAFGAAGAFAAISAALTWRIPATPLPLAVPTAGLRNTHALAGGLARRPGVRGVLVISAVAIVAYALKQSFYPLYLQEAGFSTTTIGTMLAIHGASGMIVRPMIGIGVQCLGYPVLLLGGVMAAAVGVAVVPLFATFAPLALAAGAVGAAQGLTQPLTISLLTNTVETRLRGVALGMRLSAMRLASFLSPLALGLVANWWGLDPVFYLTGAVLAATAAMLMPMMNQSGLRASIPDSFPVEDVSGAPVKRMPGREQHAIECVRKPPD